MVTEETLGHLFISEHFMFFQCTVMTGDVITKACLIQVLLNSCCFMSVAFLQFILNILYYLRLIWAQPHAS